MAQFYSDPSRENDKWALPDCEVFQLTAHEAAELDEDTVWEYSKRHEFRLASMSGKARDAMLDAIVEDCGIKGGWFYWYCFPGCLPEGSPIGPYETEADAIKACRDEASE